MRAGRALPALLPAGLFALTLASCGGADARAELPAAEEAGSAPFTPREPLDFVPADLDLVARFDLARMRAALGPAAVEDLALRAAGAAAPAGEPEDPAGAERELVARALARADSAFVASRLADLEAGDRVIVLEGAFGDFEPDLRAFAPVPAPAPGVRAHARRGEPRRDRIARVFSARGRILALVSPVEVSSVERLLSRGPDAARGDPPASGLASLDVRAKRLPPDLEKRFPSVGKLVAGLERLRLEADLGPEGARVRGELVAKGPAEAERAESFLELFAEGVRAPASRAILDGLRLDRQADRVLVRWAIPGEVVRSWVGGAEPSPPPP